MRRAGLFSTPAFSTNAAVLVVGDFFGSDFFGSDLFRSDLLLSDFLMGDAFANSVLPGGVLPGGDLPGGDLCSFDSASELLAAGLFLVSFFEVGDSTTAFLAVGLAAAAFLRAGFWATSFLDGFFSVAFFSVGWEILAELASFVLAISLGGPALIFAMAGLLAEFLLAATFFAEALPAADFTAALGLPAGGVDDFVFLGAADLVEEAGVATFASVDVPIGERLFFLVCFFGLNVLSSQLRGRDRRIVGKSLSSVKLTCDYFKGNAIASKGLGRI